MPNTPSIASCRVEEELRGPVAWYHEVVDTKRTSILFLSADPTDASRLRLGQELRDIQMRLRLANSGDALEIHHRVSVRPGDLTQAIFDTSPEIIHFSGHGSPAGQLLLENDAGQVHPVEPEALEALFALFKDDVRCVVLNACHSKKQALAISKHINHVIGMAQTIEDEAMPLHFQSDSTRR